MLVCWIETQSKERRAAGGSGAAVTIASCIKYMTTQTAGEKILLYHAPSQNTTPGGRLKNTGWRYLYG